MSEPFDADPEDIAEFLNGATRATVIPVALGQRINLHQHYEGETTCLWCGAPLPWLPMERCHPGLADDPLATLGGVPS
jgi:hypothetical protein